MLQWDGKSSFVRVFLWAPVGTAGCYQYRELAVYRPDKNTLERLELNWVDLARFIGELNSLLMHLMWQRSRDFASQEKAEISTAENPEEKA